MTFLAAAEKVLQEAKRPLTAREITEAALANGLLDTCGKTPEATMSARLYGAPRDGAIQREYVAGRSRAKRGSVRWAYVGPRRYAQHGPPRQRSWR